MWELIGLQVGMVLLMRWLNGKKDSAEIEEKIFATTDKDKMIALVAGDVIGNLMKANRIIIDFETADAIDKLVKAENHEDLVKIVATPKAKTGVADIIGNILSGIFNVFD